MLRFFSTLVLCLALSMSFGQTKDGLYAKIITSKGEVLIELEFKQTPMTVANFVGLAEGSIPNKWHAALGEGYYDGLTFHRVVPGKLIQGGCKLGNGDSNPGYYFKTEIVKSLKHDGPGVVSMANAGKKFNGSQFFITMQAFPAWDGDYTVFGHVLEGMGVVGKIKVGDAIKTIQIIRIGDAAKAFDAKATFDQLK